MSKRKRTAINYSTKTRLIKIKQGDCVVEMPLQDLAESIIEIMQFDVNARKKKIRNDKEKYKEIINDLFDDDTEEKKRLLQLIDNLFKN